MYDYVLKNIANVFVDLKTLSFKGKCNLDKYLAKNSCL